MNKATIVQSVCLCFCVFSLFLKECVFAGRLCAGEHVDTLCVEFFSVYLWICLSSCLYLPESENTWPVSPVKVCVCVCVCVCACTCSSSCCQCNSSKHQGSASPRWINKSLTSIATRRLWNAHRRPRLGPLNPQSFSPSPARLARLRIKLYSS